MKTNRKLLDRRSGEDRRIIYDIDYFLAENPERRKFSRRIQKNDRRKNLAASYNWSSIKQ